MLNINGTIVAVIINFVILIYVLNYLLYKPVLNILEERKSHIEKTLLEADAKMSQAKASVEEGLQVVNRANLTSRQIIDEANAAAAKIKKEKLERAKEEIEEQKKRAKDEIEQYRAEARRSAVKDSSRLSVMIAEKIIGRKLGQRGQRAMIDGFIDRLGR